MKKLDSTVRRETEFLALWMLILSAVMQAVFLVIGYWNYTVLLGNLLSYTVVTLNFLFIGLTVQGAVLKDEKDAKQSMRASGRLRMFFLFVTLVIGIVLPVFSNWTVIIPVFFPRIIVTFRALITKDKDVRTVPEGAAANGENGETQNAEEATADTKETEAATAEAEEADRDES